MKRVTLGDAIALDYTYHISGAMKTAVATNLANNSTLFSETLYYEDCGSSSCTPQYNGNISRMAHEMAVDGGKKRTSDYVYDFMNRLTDVDDRNQDEFDEYFAYDAQGRITSQRRGANARNSSGGEYNYYAKTNELRNVANGMGGKSAGNRDMSNYYNFVYDSEGNLTVDKSKKLKISYDWRGMPVEFVHDVSDAKDAYKLLMAYDGSGHRISKTRMRKAEGGEWETVLVTHYTGIGTEVREDNMNGTRVVVNLPQGLGRYGVEDAADPFKGIDKEKLAGYIPSTKFEWYLKNLQGESSENDLDHFHCRAAGLYATRLNHLGSTMLVYGTQSTSRPDIFDQGGVQAAYDYRAFGEQVDLQQKGDKVTENFTGKERDDETELNYFGARYLDPMLGLWTSVDPARQFASPYLYAGNGYNPIYSFDPDGNTVSGTFSKSTGLLTLTDDKTGKSVSGKYFSGGKPYGEPIPNGRYEILAQSRRPGFYRLDMMDKNPRNDVAELSDGSSRDRLRLHGSGNSIGCITACDGTNHSEIDDLLQNTETTTVKDNYDAPWYVDVKDAIKNFFSGSDSDTEITKYGELDVAD